MNKTFIRILLTCLLIALTAPHSGFSATTPGAMAEQPEKYVHAFTTKDFKLNQDGLKYEVPENGAYRIVPRLKSSEIWTHFPIADEHSSYLEWRVTSVVRAAENPAAGVAIWGETTGYALYVFPDGKGYLRQYENRKSVWTANFTVTNFSYPANLTLWRDANGSIIAMVDGTVVAVKLFPVDVKTPATEKIASVSFATCSTASKTGSPVFYEKLDVEAWGKKAVVDLFDEMLKKEKEKE